MISTHRRFRDFSLAGLCLLGAFLVGCEPSASAPRDADKAKAAQMDKKTNSGGGSQPSQEPGPAKLAEKKQEPAPAPANGQPKAGKGADPAAADSAKQAEDESKVAGVGQEDDPPGFLPNTPPERKFPFALKATWKRLSDKEEIWIDQQQKHVIVSGRICLTRGVLEMFACPKGMKEHESIVATYPLAMYVHQALLLIGANPGRTVQWEPEYKPAEGPKIQVECWFYNEKNELVMRNAKDMVRQVSDGSTLKIDWVFGGSKFLVDPDGRELYAANGGELICVSNFSSAMIDLPIPSTAEAGGLLFEANTEMIPPLDTPVLLVLKPEFPPAAEKAGQTEGGE